jgi:nicotinamide riboside kinase
MRVYLVGSHSSGKSTLARYISEKYNLPMIVEVARQVLSEQELQLDSLRYDLDIVDSYQKQVFYRQIQEESKQNSFVSDRSFDNLAYAAQHSRVLTKLLNSKELKEYINSLKSEDSYIFFVRPSKATLKADGVRETLRWSDIIAIDAMVKFLIEMFELPYFQINMHNMQERIKMIDTVLSKCK